MLRRLLLRLAHQRVQAPGEPVPREALVGAGWPGDRASPESALNRLYVALARMRKAGFEGILRFERGGYLLDPDLPIRIVDPEG